MLSKLCLRRPGIKYFENRSESTPGNLHRLPVQERSFTLNSHAYHRRAF